MEHMLGSLDRVARLVQRQHTHFPEPAIGKIAVHVRASVALQAADGPQVLRGLIYLKNKLRVMHRGAAMPATTPIMRADIKPSNILLGFNGSVKLCDFGISKRMDESLLMSRVGSWRYLAVRLHLVLHNL